MNVGLQTNDAVLKREAAGEVRWVLERMNSPEGLAPFLADTQVEHGVFYLGWRNRLLGRLLASLPAGERLPGEISEFNSQSDELAAAFRAAPALHLDAYPGQAWPCDNVMALASLTTRFSGSTRGTPPCAWETGNSCAADATAGGSFTT